MTAPTTTNRTAITYDQLHKIAENLRARHNLDRPWGQLSHRDQEDWLTKARRLLHRTGIHIR